MMAICRIYEVEGATLDQYDQVDEAIGGVTPEGAKLHVAGLADGTLRVIEVWESREHVDRFMQEQLGAQMQGAQLPEPQITEFEVHKLDWLS
jgi:hypothetical protein